MCEGALTPGGRHRKRGFPPRDPWRDLWRIPMPFLLILGLAGFSSALSMRAMDPMLTLVADDFQVTLQRAALLATAFTLPYAATQLVFGPAGDALGRVRLIRVTLAMLTLSLMLCALAPSHDVLLVARIVAGGWAGGVIPVALATVGDRVSYAERPIALGRLLSAIVLGQLSGAVVSGMIANAFGWRAVFWTCAAVTCTAALGAIFFLKEAQERETLSFGRALKGYLVVFSNPLSIRLFAVAAIEGGLIFGCFPFVGAHLAAFDLGHAVEAGFAIGAFGLGGVFYTLVVRVMVNRLGLSGMAGIGAVLAGLCLIGVVLVPTLPLVIGVFLLLGFGFYMLHNTIQILATELVPTARGAGVALYATCFFAGQATGAFIAAQVIGMIGSVGLFTASGIGLILLAWPASRLPLRVRTSP